jgi:hypothetical protein
MQQKRKRPFNWGSAIGWLIFVLVIAGGPLFSLLRQALRGVITLPANTVPYLIGGLVALSILVSVVRSIAQSTARRGDTRLPTTTMPSSGQPRPNAAMPPFGGVEPPRRLPPGRAALGSRSQIGLPGEPRAPTAPRFDPIINPALLIAGLVGLALLGAVALLVWGWALP